VAVTLTRTFELRALLQTSRPSVCPADEDLRDYSLTLNRLIGLPLRTFDVVPPGCGAQRLSHVDNLLLFYVFTFFDRDEADGIPFSRSRRGCIPSSNEARRNSFSRWFSCRHHAVDRCVSFAQIFDGGVLQLIL